MTLAIETVNLSKRYGPATALDQLNLAISKGSIFGFIGPNGAGKTTTLRLLAGLLEPSSGEIRLLGQPMRDGGRTAQRLVGYMPDFFGVYDDLRVWEYLDFFARCYGLSANERRSTVDSLLELVDLGAKRNAYVQSLSRGMQQRLCLAHALVHDPPILLLDEPASGLDPRARVELRELLRTLRDLGKTILLSSHILSELAEVCSEIGIIEGGKMLVSGTVEAVQRQLQGGTRLRVKVLNAPEIAAAALDNLISGSTTAPNLPRLHQAQIDPVDERVFLLALESPDEEQQAALLSYLIGAGVVISEYRLLSESLEDLFLRLTANLEGAA